MNALSELWSSLFDYGFLGFIGSAVCICAILGLYGLFKSDADSSGKFWGAIILIGVLIGGATMRENAKNDTHAAYNNDVLYDRDDNVGGSNVSFRGNDHEGKKCSLRHKSGAYCDCSGCYGGNWDRQTCQRCKHPVDDHNGH